MSIRFHRPPLKDEVTVSFWVHFLRNNSQFIESSIRPVTVFNRIPFSYSSDTSIKIPGLSAYVVGKGRVTGLESVYRCDSKFLRTL